MRRTFFHDQPASAGQVCSEAISDWFAIGENAFVVFHSSGMEGAAQVTGIRNQVTRGSPTLDRIWLKFLQPHSVDRREPGEKVSVRIYARRQVIGFDSEVLRVFGPDNEHFILSKPVDGSVVKHERPVSKLAQLSFSVVIIDSKEKERIGASVPESRTLEISPEGLRFDTETEFREGDQVSLAIRLSSSRRLNLSGHVVLCERIDHSFRVTFQFFQLSEEDWSEWTGFLGRIESVAAARPLPF